MSETGSLFRPKARQESHQARRTRGKGRKINYKDGEQHGSWESFYKNGQLHGRAIFKDGEKDGLWEKFDEEGNLTKTETYKDGKLIEEWNE